MLYYLLGIYRVWTNGIPGLSHGRLLSYQGSGIKKDWDAESKIL